MLDPSQVSAVLVTYGNRPLDDVLDSLIFPDVVVWDNSGQPHPDAKPNVRYVGTSDQKTYGRTVATMYTKHRIVYSQDDDIVHSPENQRAILAAYQPGVLTGCMWDDWSAGAAAQGIPGGYRDLVFMGSGSVFDDNIPQNAVTRYLSFHARDEFFRLWADTIVGVIAPTQQLDIRFEALPCADDENRMANLPGAEKLKRIAIERAREVRDKVAA